MKFCKKCVMPDTRPGIVFSNEGICSACTNYAKRKIINWEERWEQLETLCKKYRGCNGNGYDCAIAVSGGKDSHFQVHLFKDQLGMNPVLYTVNNFVWTDTGLENISNISDAFGCDILHLTPNLKAMKKISKKALIKLGSPMWYADAAIYAFPYRMAIRMGLQLLVYGENVSYEYGGFQRDETYSAKKQFENDVVKPVNYSDWLDEDITMKDLQVIVNPTYDEIEKAGLEPIYLSYFVPWNSHRNYLVAKRYGFRQLIHEWIREGTVEQYNQIDSLGYLINQWFKYPKFGHASVTEMTSRWIRAGMMTREEAITLVRQYDKNLDQGVLDEFLYFIGMSHREFWDIADKWYNPDLFEKDKFGVWKEKFNLE